MNILSKLRWALCIVCQAVAALIISLALLLISFSMSSPLGGHVYDLSMWALIPACAFILALLAVKFGLHYFVAWIAPGLCQILAQFILTGLLPSSAGMPMVTFLLALIGAATGEELMRRKRGGKKRHG